MIDVTMPDNEIIDNAIEFLKNCKVNKKILSRMKFSLSNKRNVKINAGYFGSSVLLIKDGDFEFLPNVPDEWFENCKSDVNPEELLAVHPQRELVSALVCIGTSQRTVISIVPKQEILYKLKDKVIAPGKHQCDIFDWFSHENLIEGPGEELFKRAAKTIQESFDNFKLTCKDLCLPDNNDSIKEIIKLIKNITVPKTLKCEKTDESFRFIWNKFSVWFYFESESFSKVEEPYTKILSSVQKTQKAIIKGEELKKGILDSGKELSCSLNLDLTEKKVFLKVDYQNFSREYIIENRAFARTSKEAWKKHKEALKEDAETDKKMWDEMDPDLKNSVCCGSLLAECIADTVRQNMLTYYGISLSSLLKKVRGLTTYHYEGGKYAGLFSLIPANEVEDMVYEMRDLQLLKIETVSGEYAYYEKVRLNESPAVHCVRLYGHPKSCTEFSDQNWLLEIRNPTYKWEWNDILSLLEHPAVYCVDPEAYIKYFVLAPEDIISYLKMTSKIGEKIQKKICKQIITEIKNGQYGQLKRTAE